MKRAGRSLKASEQGINRANKAILMFATKLDLAVELNISRATVQNFFAGKSIGRENFHNICQKLKLPWQEIVELNQDPEDHLQQREDNDCDPIDNLVAELRHYGRANIQQKCGIMRVLDMSQPIGLNDIYTDVNILEKISGRRRLEVTKLVKACVAEFERPDLSKIAQERVLGLEAVKNYSKLIVLGKPGAGKTTFLKHIAIQCSFGEFQANLVPIFITLKDFAEAPQHPSLLQYILSDAAYPTTKPIQQVLSQGRALLLLDGLDEVQETDDYRVAQEIRNFSSKFHANQIVITCRVATREYTFEQFTEVEIADFDDVQIATFINKWFAASDPTKSNTLIKKLEKNHLQELATNPLLLTLLCLMVEESLEFPSNRSQLYEEGLNVLLKKWDAKRNIEREQIYKKLSIYQKEDLLSQIAFKTFEQGDYFFKQKELEQYIADYICNLPSVSSKLEALQLSKVVLKSIEAQHGLLVERARGIYSFSHLTFHEYFTAREIVRSSDPQAINRSLKQLVSHITQQCWREVFLLTVEMLRSADYLLQLIKQQTDQLLAADKHLQAFLSWLSEKSSAVTADYKSVAIRTFYLTLERILTLVSDRFTLDSAIALAADTLEIAFTLDHELALNRSLELDLTLRSSDDLVLDRALALALARALVLNRVLELALAPELELDQALALELDLTRALDLVAPTLNPKLALALKRLEAQLPDPEIGIEKFKQWWKEKGRAWVNKLRTVINSHRNIGHNWQFSEQQHTALNQYYDANSLLVDCLNSYCYVTRAVRQEIEETLFLPIQKAEGRR